MKNTESTGRNRTPKKSSAGLWKPAFLATLRKLGNVTAAAQAAQVARSTVHEARQSDPDFSDAWKDALEEAGDHLEAEARRRAVEGVAKPVYQGGQKVGTIREYSDVLLIFLLKGARPAKYADRQKLEHSGNVTAKIVRLPPKEDPS